MGHDVFVGFPDGRPDPFGPRPADAGVVAGESVTDAAIVQFGRVGIAGRAYAPNVEPDPAAKAFKLSKHKILGLSLFVRAKSGHSGRRREIPRTLGQLRLGVLDKSFPLKPPDVEVDLSGNLSVLGLGIGYDVGMDASVNMEANGGYGALQPGRIVFAPFADQVGGQLALDGATLKPLIRYPVVG